MSSKTSKIKWPIIIFTFVVGVSDIANADFIFGSPINLGPTVNTTNADNTPGISVDGLSLYFNDYPDSRPGGRGSSDIWFTTRTTKSGAWGTPVNLGSTVNSSYRDGRPSISADGLELFFHSERPGGRGKRDIWVTTRPTIQDPWSRPVNLGSPINTSDWDGAPSISGDGLSLFFDSSRPGGFGVQDLWVSMRNTRDDDWSEPINLGPIVNSTSDDWSPSISSDSLKLFFVCDMDLWVTIRATTEDDWGLPVNLGPNVNSSDWDIGPSISADDSVLYFSSDRPGGSGGFDIWQALIKPVVDFNGDGIVDSDDMCIMVDHWGQNNPLCDIGPTPLGDGIVDVEDLKVLAEYLFEEILSPGCVAYWRFDETEGEIASDSIWDKDSLLFGGPLWRPEEGRKNGALEFDGIDDYIGAPFVLDPSIGPLSAAAWIKGGSPGQVIISQQDGTGTGAIWLGADLSDGKLMTSLAPPAGGRSSKPSPLVSDFQITDGDWHYIGIVVAGQTSVRSRSLYLDGVMVSSDNCSQLNSSNGGLIIGAGKNLDADTLFSGLIDDVRIYNVALSAEEIVDLAQ